VGALKLLTYYKNSRNHRCSLDPCIYIYYIVFENNLLARAVSVIKMYCFKFGQVLAKKKKTLPFRNGPIMIYQDDAYKNKNKKHPSAAYYI